MTHAEAAFLGLALFLAVLLAVFVYLWAWERRHALSWEALHAEHRCPPCGKPHPESPYLDTARLIRSEIARQTFKNGTQRRQAALVALLNHHPDAREGDLIWANEIAYREARDA